MAKPEEMQACHHEINYVFSSSKAHTFLALLKIIDFTLGPGRG